jgi:hypothetical protein
MEWLRRRVETPGPGQSRKSRLLEAFDQAMEGGEHGSHLMSCAPNHCTGTLRDAGVDGRHSTEAATAATAAQQTTSIARWVDWMRHCLQPDSTRPRHAV